MTQAAALETPAAELSLYEAHIAHMDALRHQRRSPATLRAYSAYVGGFIRFLHERGVEDPALAHLSPRWVTAYQDHIRAHSEGSRGGAVAESQAVRLLKTFGTWLWRREYYVVDPLSRLDPPRLAKMHRVPFSKLDCLRLLEAALMGPDPLMERALLLLALDTGARIGELVQTNLEDLDLAEGTVLFRKTKNGRPRRVFFRVNGRPDGGPCAVAISDWLAVRDARAEHNVHTLFVGRDGCALSTEKARRIYHGLGESAGVANAIPHRGRHTHATEFLSEMPGAEMHLRNRLGHISPDVLASYVTISDGMARQVADVASLSAKWDL
jgi:integrase/recombinase XerD